MRSHHRHHHHPHRRHNLNRHSRTRFKWYQLGEPYPRIEDFRRMVDAKAEPVTLVLTGVPFWQFGGPDAYPPRPPRYILLSGDVETLSLLGGRVIDEYKGFWLAE